MENLYPDKYASSDAVDSDEIGYDTTLSVKQEEEEEEPYIPNCYQKDLENIIKYTKEIQQDEYEFKMEENMGEYRYSEDDRFKTCGNNEYVDVLTCQQLGFSPSHRDETLEVKTENIEPNNNHISFTVNSNEIRHWGNEFGQEEQEYLDTTETDTSTCVTIKPKKVNLRTIKDYFKRCSYCKYEAKDEIDWSEHRILKHTKSANQKCKFCKFISKTTSDLELHISNNHVGQMLYKCEHCTYETGYAGNLNRHINSVHVTSKEHPCRYCDFVATDFKAVKRHIQKNHKKLVISGNINSKNQPEIEYLNKDESKEKSWRQSRSKGEKSFRCQYCDYSTYFGDYLNNHINSRHTQATRYKCQYCEYEATKLYTLRCHINSKHTKTVLYKCQLCNLETTRSNILKRHIERKHVEKRFACKVCDYVAKKEGHLRKHMTRKHKMNSCEVILDDVKVEDEFLEVDNFVKVESDLVKYEDMDSL